MERKTPTRTHASKGARQLLPLMFEFGRILKREIVREDFGTLSLLHLETLRFIAEEGKPTMSAVAEYLKIAAPTATVLVELLVKEGYLVREADRTDRRRVLLAVSAQGKRYLIEAGKKRERAFARVIEPLAERDRIELARIFTRIINAA